MMGYLLDTCVISDFVKGDENTLKLLKSTTPTDIFILSLTAETLNPDTKLYIHSYTNSLKPKIVNMTSSPQTNEHN